MDFLDLILLPSILLVHNVLLIPWSGSLSDLTTQTGYIREEKKHNFSDRHGIRKSIEGRARLLRSKTIKDEAV